MKSKLPETGTTIFAVMSGLAAECDAINLSQGYPSFNPDQVLLDLITHHLNNDGNQYAPMTGVPKLRQAIAEKVALLYERKVDADHEVTVCDGATEGLFSAIQATVHPGDEVIVFDPAYDSYEPSITLAGGETIHIPLIESSSDNNLQIDWDRLKQAINKRTRLIIVNFPHNPTGIILTREDLQRLAEIVRDTNIYFLSDEVYEHIIFDGHEHQSLLRHDELWERTFVVSSFGKTYHSTGWKVGYCVAPANLTAEFRKIHQWVCYTVVSPIQHALGDYLPITTDHYAELPRFYEKKRDRFCELIKDSRFKYHPTKGTFFQMLDYSAISTADDVSYAKQLTREIGVASIPISVVCAEPVAGHHLRFCFAKDDFMLEEAAARLCQL